MKDIRVGPLSVSMNPDWWKFCWNMRKHDGLCGLFRNRKSVIPGRWGFYFLGVEFGSRDPGDRFGLWPF